MHYVSFQFSFIFVLSILSSGFHTYRILESLDTFLENIDLSTVSKNTTDNRTVFSFDTFALQVEKIDPNNFIGQTFLVDLGSVEEAVNISQGIDEDSLLATGAILDVLTNATASVQLPPTFLDNCTNPDINSEFSQRLSYSVFVSDVLFQPENRTRYKVGSIVVAAKSACDLRNNISSSPVQTTFLTSETVILN